MARDKREKRTERRGPVLLSFRILRDALRFFIFISDAIKRFYTIEALIRLAELFT